jgi:hypothetical protein
VALEALREEAAALEAYKAEAKGQVERLAEEPNPTHLYPVPEPDVVWEEAKRLEAEAEGQVERGEAESEALRRRLSKVGEKGGGHSPLP